MILYLLRGTNTSFSPFLNFMLVFPASSYIPTIFIFVRYLTIQELFMGDSGEIVYTLPRKLHIFQRNTSNIKNLGTACVRIKSLHLARKYAGIFVHGHYVFREANSFLRGQLQENCERLGTENVQGQISEHIFSPNGGHCVFYPSNIFRHKSSFENWGNKYSRIFPSFRCESQRQRLCLLSFASEGIIEYHSDILQFFRRVFSHMTLLDAFRPIACD